MDQFEMRMFAMYQEPARLLDSQIEAMTFEATLSLALELGLKRFDRKTLAKLCGIHYPHFGDLIAGKRPFPAMKLDRFCMLTACEFPQQWLDLQKRKDLEKYKAASAQIVGEYIQNAMQRAA
ncbi:hypothetical protein G3N58_17730 [Paraburkholderia sp. Ac-20342]|uniref:hypothetical protein n=1 Tax=Paraburkholderia sp. Ac-20342 TaxID=2703889 RepID=UPI00197E8DFE|nr:hypothetical protein [Paraburkholderia sp. Ac-20342]MBN3848649.1 hypothetical protein [Paraburkholderia sp. Ac-20342]